MRKRLEDIVCIALLLTVALFALWPAVFAGRVPFATQSALFQTPWEAERPEGMPRPFDEQEQLQASRYYPWYVYLTAAASGEGSLLWNPLEGCGQPFLAVWRTRCLSPFSLPFYAFPVDTAITLSVLLKLFVAGLAAYYVGRKFGLRPGLALSAAVAFQLSGHVYLWLGWPMSDVMPWLPLLALSTERLAIGQARYWTIGAIVTALMALGGDPETLAGALLFCGAYFVVRAGLQRTSPTGLASFGAMAALIAGGLALAGGQLVPYAEFVTKAAATGADNAETTLRLPDLVLAYLPRFLGRSLGIWTGGGELRHARVIRLVHVGLLQLMLASVWLAVRSFVAQAQRRRVDALLWTVLVMTALAMVAGRALGYVPWLRELGPQHFLAGNALALALAGAAAADEWLLLNARQCIRALRRLALYIPLLIALGAAAAAVHHGVPRLDAPPLSVQAVKSGLLVLGLLVLLLATLLKPSHRLMGYGLTVLTAVSLVAAWTPGLRYVDRDLTFPDTSLVQAVRAAGERVGGSGRLAEWPLAAELVPQVYAPAGVVLRRQKTFLDRLDEEPLLLRRSGAPALLLTKEDIQGAYARVRPMLSIDRVFPSGAVLFSDLASKPRAWMLYDYRTAPPGDTAEFDAALPPVVETANGAAPIHPSSNAGQGAASRADITAASATAVTVDVETLRPGILVLADTHYPGWRATVDGKDARIFPVDAMFRGVAVDAGRHEVQFRYRPRSVQIGLYLTLAAALVVLVELRRVFWRAYY